MSEKAILQVHHYANQNGLNNSPEEDAKVTLNPYSLQTVVSRDIEVNGVKLKKVTIIFVDSGAIDLNVNFMDAQSIEDAVGLVPEF